MLGYPREPYLVQVNEPARLPTGSIIGPLLFLIYVSDLPNCLNISCARMFADDTNITVRGCTLAELGHATSSELTNLYSWLKANKLSLNITKTELMVIGPREKFLAENYSELNIQLDDQPINRVKHAKSLGLTFMVQSHQRPMQKDILSNWCTEAH